MFQYSKYLDFKNSSNVIIHLSSPFSTISYLHVTNHDDIINKNSNFPILTGERISTLKYATKNTSKIVHILSKLRCQQNEVVVFGEHANKCAKEILDALQLRCFADHDYVGSTVKGCNFLLNNIDSEIFQYKKSETYIFPSLKGNLFPYLLVLVNSKIIFIKVATEKGSEKIFESSFDCNFLVEIAEAVFGIKSMEEFLEYISVCNKRNGVQPNNSDESGTLQSDYEDVLHKEKLALSLFHTFMSNLCQLIFLHSAVNNLHNVIFGDYFNKTIFKDTLTDFFSKRLNSTISLFFMRHQGISTAMGTLLGQKQSEFNTSWQENYSLSSGIASTHCWEDDKSINSYLVLDSVKAVLVFCPLLKHPSTYVPYLQDLYYSQRAREYWLGYSEEGIKFAVQKKLLEDPNSNVTLGYTNFIELFHDKAEHLKKFPHSYGPLTFGLNQELMRQIKKELGLFNSHHQTKIKETRAALNHLKDLLSYFDGFASNERQIKIAESSIAGNLFDYACLDMVKLFKTNADFKIAMGMIPQRPWLIDNLDSWIERLQGPSHKLAAIFPDNCGFDFVLGIIPLTRELIKRGTQVVLCVNVEPIHNDVTVPEVKYILNEVSQMCPIMGSAYLNKQLTILNIFNTSPSIDFRYVSEEFAELSKEMDLLVLAGMGRSVFTNFEAEFNIECLRVAIIKDNWISEELGGQGLSAVFRYTK